jgi:1,4-alpha-glucan branching enzyme
MNELANHFPTANGVLEEALNQAAREVLLAQSSDWAFIMKTGTMVEYAIRELLTT